MNLKASIIFLIFIGCHAFVKAQGYVRMYSDTRDVSTYTDYQQIIARYNKTGDYKRTVASLDSVAAVYLDKGEPGAYLFHVNDAANILLTKGKQKEALNLLKHGMLQFSKNSKELHWEYVCSLILLGYIPNNGFERLELLNRQLALMDSMKVNNQAYLHAIINKGRFLSRTDRIHEGLVCYKKGRELARASQDLYSIAVIDYWSLLSLRTKSKSETIAELIKLKIKELQEFASHSAIHYYLTNYSYLLAQVYYTDLEIPDSAFVALEQVEREIAKNPAAFFRLSAMCDAMKCALSGKLENKQPELIDSLTREVIRKDLEMPLSHKDRVIALKMLLDNRTLSIENKKTLSTVISKQLKNQNDWVLSYLNLKIEVLKQLNQQDSIPLCVRQCVDYHDKNVFFMNRVEPSVSLIEQGRLYWAMASYFQKKNNSQEDVFNNQQMLKALCLADSAYRMYGQKHYTGVEYSAFAKEYKQFIDTSLVCMERFDMGCDLFIQFILSSKALGISNYINNLQVQADYESDSLEYKKSLDRLNVYQELKNQLVLASNSDSIKELQHKLSDVIFYDLRQQYSIRRARLDIVKITSINEIQANLKSDECLLDYRIVDDRLIILSVTSKRFKVITKEIPEGIVNNNRYRLKSGGKMQKEFSDLLLEDLDLERSFIKHLIIIPDEMLFTIPFESLLWQDKYLVELFSVRYQYSSELWLNSVEKCKQRLPWHMLSIAPGFLSQEEWEGYLAKRGMEQRISLAPLKYSLEEVDELERLNRKANLPYRVLRGEFATEERVKQLMPQYSVLHFATHGVVDKARPELSGLYLSVEHGMGNSRDGGFLSLGEIYNQHLNANLAILSACKTGMGKIREGEGMTALPRGFLLAGVPNVIATLWDVDDLAAKELMIYFYDYVIKEDFSYTQALQLAKKKCIECGKLPLDWAGFVLIGG